MTKDAYTWTAFYEDGSSIREYDHPDGHGFAVVDSAQVKRLALVCDLRSHSVVVPSGAEPVFFRRRSIIVNLVDESTESRQTVHCIGWKHDDKAVYLFVFEDGSTLLTDDLQAV
jgi:hypothetical protein